MDRYNQNYAERIEKAARSDSGVKNGAGWLFAIGGLSIVNTLIYALGIEIYFVVGLGITQIVQGFFIGFGEATGTNLTILIFITNILISSTFFVLGVFAKKAQAWAFIVGMVFYGIDAAIFSIFGDWFGFLFHVFALFMIFKGYKALRAIEFSSGREILEQRKSLENNPALERRANNSSLL